MLLTAPRTVPKLVPSTATPVSPEVLGWGVTAARVRTTEVCPCHELPRRGPVGVFLRMGFLPNQFTFSPAPALVPSSPGELEALRPSPGGWRQGGPSVEGAGDTRGDVSDVAGPLTSELQARSFRLRPSLPKSRGQEIEA